MSKNDIAYMREARQIDNQIEEMYAFLSYFDTKNLATTISAPTLACIGLQDNVCPPHTNIAPYNNLLSTDKELIFNPELMHQAGATWYSDMMAFFATRIDNTTTGAEAVSNQSSALSRKMIVNGELLIFRDNRLYTALGFPASIAK